MGLACLKFDPAVAAQDAHAEILRRKFSRFVIEAWGAIDPAPLVWGPHLEALCLHLQAIAEGKIRRLLISIPPGHAKSMIVAVLWPAWRWLRTPAWAALFASYAEDLVTRDATKCRTLIEGPWYKALAARLADMRRTEPWTLTADQNRKDFYSNTAHGARMSLSVTGRGTGFRGDAIVVDDPMKADDAHSEAARIRVVRWWRETMPSRLNDLALGEKVVIAQRLHEADLPGIVLEGGDFEHLCLPTEFEPGGVCSCSSCRRGSSIGWKDWRTEPGELLFPEKFPREVIDEAKDPARGMGTFAFAAQHQQRPVPAGGGLLKIAWFDHVWRRPGEPEFPAGDYDPNLKVEVIDPEHSKFDQWLMVVDAAFKSAATNDFVAIEVWARKGANLYLIDLAWEHLGFGATCEAIKALSKKWPKCTTKLIEDKANGSAVIETLRSQIPGIIPVEPAGGKDARIAAAAPYCEARNVRLPAHAAWRQRFIAEACAFPNAAHDDAIDAAAYAVLRMGTRAGAAAQRLAMMREAVSRK